MYNWLVGKKPEFVGGVGCWEDRKRPVCLNTGIRNYDNENDYLYFDISSIVLRFLLALVHKLFTITCIFYSFGSILQIYCT